MKIKALLLATCAAAGICFASCSNENSPVDNEGTESQAIAFGTYMAKPAVTKAETDATALDALKESGFGVFAHYTGATNFAATEAKPYNFMFNQKVTYKATTGPWEYTPVKYWPNTTDDKVSFFAYAPYKQTADSDKGITKLPAKADNVNAASLEYTLATESDDIVDLLYAQAKDKTNTKHVGTQTGDKVKFEFKHALAQVAFKVKTTVDGGTDGPANTKVYVESIKIHGDALKNKGTLNLATGAWTIGTDAAAASISGETDDFTDAVKYPSSSSITDWGSMTTTGVTNTAQDLFAASDMFVIIPAKDTKFKVTIKYHVLTKDESLSKGFTDVPNEVTSGDITLATVEMNKKYTINMNLGLKTVVFDEPTVAEWEAATSDKEIKLPEITK